MRKVIMTLILTTNMLSAMAQSYESGEKVFKMNCAACHKMDAKLIGPPLINVVADQGEAWTRSWILNNDELRKSGDAHAVAIYEEYNKMVMPNYSYLSDQELTDLIAYLKDWEGNQVAKAAVVPDAAGTQTAAAEPESIFPELSSASKWAVFLVGGAVLLTVITMYSLLNAFKAIVSYKSHQSVKSSSEEL